MPSYKQEKQKSEFYFFCTFMYTYMENFYLYFCSYGSKFR